MFASLRMIALAAVATGLAAGAFAAPDDGAIPAEKSLPLQNQDAFAFNILAEEERVEHSLSGLVCPFQIDGHGLTGLAQYSVSGDDVSCAYHSPDGGSALTFYFSRYGESMTPDVTVDSALAAMRQKGHFGEEIENGLATISFGGTDHADCRAIVLDSDPPQTPQKTGVWGCNFDGWVYKVRATWPPSSPDAMAGMQTFSAAQTETQSRIDLCRAWETDEDVSAETLEDSATVMMVMATVAIDEASHPAIPDRACYMGGWNDKTSAINVMAFPESQSMAWQVNHADLDGYVTQRYATVTKATAYIEALSGEELTETAATGLWLMLSELNDGKVGLFRIYEKRPGISQTTADIVALLDGELVALSALEFDAEGNTNLMLSIPD